MQTLLVSTGTASASAMYTFHSFAFLQLFLGYTADTRRAKVGIARLNTSQTAELLKTRLPKEREWSEMILCKSHSKFNPPFATLQWDSHLRICASQGNHTIPERLLYACSRDRRYIVSAGDECGIPATHFRQCVYPRGAHFQLVIKRLVACQIDFFKSTYFLSFSSQTLQASAQCHRNLLVDVSSSVFLFLAWCWKLQKDAIKEKKKNREKNLRRNQQRRD